MVGRVDRLNMRPAIDHWKAKGVDLSRILYQPKLVEGAAIHQCETQDHGLDHILDVDLIAASILLLLFAVPMVLIWLCIKIKHSSSISLSLSFMSFL
jgi:glutamate synthase (NADPH/NADH) large chain